MSDNIENTNNYLRLFSMYLDLGTDTLLSLFLNLISDDGHEDVSSFLHDRTNIRILSELKKQGALNLNEFILVTAADPVPQKFDITLLIKLITNLFSSIVSIPVKTPQPKDYSVGADLYRLRKVRNKLVHHPLAQMPLERFNYLWDKISTTLLRVAQQISADVKEALQEKISKYIHSTLDKDDAAIKSKLHKLQEWKREVEVLKEKTDDLIKNLNGFELLLKQTPKRYIRYIKLLFDGGKLVLLGVLDRECERAQKTLSDVLRQNQEAFLNKMTDTEDINKLLPPERSEADPSTWDVSIIASVILISFPDLNLDEVTKIERIRDARNQYAVTALSLVAQESDDLFEQSAVLIHSLTSLSADLKLQTRQKLDLMIRQYPKLEVHEDDTIDKHLNELGKHGGNIKSIEDLYKEHMDQLRNTLREMNEHGIHFQTPHEIQIKIVTVCEEEETKRNAEDTLEKVYSTALVNDGVNTSLSPSNHLDKEVETLIRRFSCHPDVTASGIKRNCITLFLSCSSCQGILHVIDYIGSQHFDKIQSRISDELSYMYGEAFAVRGNIPLESICGVLKDPRNERGQIEGGLSLAIECSSSEGIRHVLSLLGDNETTNSFNHISDMLTSKYDKKVSVQGFADLKGLSDLYEGTDTDTSDSLKDLDEDGRLCAQNITDVEDIVTPTYLENESQTLRESRSEKDSVRTEQRIVEDSQSDKKPNPEHEFSKEEDGVLTETELQYQDEDVQMGTGTIEEDESQFST
ncbi:uncharacterized protein LOC128554562, partial [Mercenaria mercenaria]|uniref:uncharacterized protein LOC128554562 n=1 Tax=Mercenaria mercenaria TaxID=6596 RepID=UPI00234F87D5